MWVKPGAGGACYCSWLEWTPAYPSCAAPSEARSVGASVEVGASADLRHMHNATVKRPAFRRIWAGVGETWGGRRVQIDLVRMGAELPVLRSAL